MSHRKLFLFSTSLLIAMVGLNTLGLAQRTTRVNSREVALVLGRIEAKSETFRNNLDRSFSRYRGGNTSTRDEISRQFSAFVDATTNFRNRLNSRQETQADVERLVSQGWAIDSYLQNNRLDNTSMSNWQSVATDLRALAQYYNVSWQSYNNQSYNNDSAWTRNRDDSRNDNRNSGWNPNGNYSRNSARNLTGTWQLNTTRSDNTQNIIDRAIRGSNSNDASRTRAMLSRRLEAPDQLAIEQSGRNFTIASSSAPQFAFEANGQTQSETRPNGRTVKTTARVLASSLKIESLGDRGNDYDVTFEPLDNGRSLRVTRRFYTENLSTPVVSQSIYDRTSETAQLDIFRGNRDRDGSFGNNGSSRSGNFGISNDTVLTAILNEDLTTQSTREGDRFTLTVQSPRQYNGAVIEGYIRNADRSGRVTGKAALAMEFQRIRFTNGQSYDFSGYIDEIRTTNGEKVTIDNEGVARDTDNQTTSTVARSGIGAALGAIIGGIAGGGKGAAIGAAVGAGAGAGSVIVQGRNDLKLMQGTEFSIRASAPLSSSSNR